MHERFTVSTECLSSFVEFAQNPEATWEWIKAINENGVWTITSGSNREGIPVRGIFLTLIWIAEAAIIGFVTFALSREEASKPYSERQGKWLTAKTLPKHIAFINNQDDFLNALARGDYSALTTPLSKESAFSEKDGDDDEEDREITNYAEVVLYPDAFEPYVSVSNVSLQKAEAASETQAPKSAKRKKWFGWLTGWFSSEKKEEGVTTVEIVQYLKISPTVAQNITNALGV